MVMGDESGALEGFSTLSLNVLPAMDPRLQRLVGQVEACELQIDDDVGLRGQRSYVGVGLVAHEYAGDHCHAAGFDHLANPVGAVQAWIGIRVPERPPGALPPLGCGGVWAIRLNDRVNTIAKDNSNFFI